jgi:hypothetical protein
MTSQVFCDAGGTADQGTARPGHSRETAPEAAGDQGESGVGMRLTHGWLVVREPYGCARSARSSSSAPPTGSCSPTRARASAPPRSKWSSPPWPSSSARSSRAQPDVSREVAMLSFVLESYEEAVGPQRELRDAQQLREQQVFASEAATEVCGRAGRLGRDLWPRFSQLSAQIKMQRPAAGGGCARARAARGARPPLRGAARAGGALAPSGPTSQTESGPQNTPCREGADQRLHGGCAQIRNHPAILCSEPRGVCSA